MKPRNVRASSIALTLVGLVLAQPSGQAQAPTTGSAPPIFMPAADVKWADLDPTGAPGVKIAPLWGDPGKGPFGAFLKLPAGFAAPLHTHTPS